MQCPWDFLLPMLRTSHHARLMAPRRGHAEAVIASPIASLYIPLYTYSATACYRIVYFAPHTQREAVAFYRAVFRKLFHFIYKHRQPSIDVSCIDTLTIVLLSTHTPTHIHLGDFGNRFELGWVMPCTDFTAQAMSEQLRKLVGSKRDHPPWKEIKFRWRHDIFCLQLL